MRYLTRLLQQVQPVELLRCALLGYQAREEAVGAMLNGGGSGAADPLVHRGRSAAGLGGSAYGQHLLCLFPLSAASLAAGNGASKGKM